MTIIEAKAWLDARYAAGATRLGCTCNPVQRKLWLFTENERIEIDCPSRHQTVLRRDLLHEHIERMGKP